MFCKKCGEQVVENSKFCGKCGESTEGMDNAMAEGRVPVYTESPMVAPTYQAQPMPGTTEPIYQQAPQMTGMAVPMKKSSKGKKIGIGVVAIIAIIIAVVLFTTLGGKPYEKPLKQLIKGMQNGNASQILDASPDIFVKMLQSDGMTKKEIIEELNEELEYTFRYMANNYGKNFKVKYEIEEVYELKRAEIREIEEDFEYYNDIKIKISQAYELTVELGIIGNSEEEWDSTTVIVGKIDGRWNIIEGLWW